MDAITYSAARAPENARRLLTAIDALNKGQGTERTLLPTP
jgi:hypothetical protein